MNEIKYIYRYERRYHDEYASENTISINLKKFAVIKETKCTYLIKVLNNKEKRVFKNAKNSFAFDTVEKARTNFINRCKRQIQICNSQLEIAEMFLLKSTALFQETKKI